MSCIIILQFTTHQPSRPPMGMLTATPHRRGPPAASHIQSTTFLETNIFKYRPHTSCGSVSWRRCSTEATCHDPRRRLGRKDSGCRRGCSGTCRQSACPSTTRLPPHTWLSIAPYGVGTIRIQSVTTEGPSRQGLKRCRNRLWSYFVTRPNPPKPISRSGKVARLTLRSGRISGGVKMSLVRKQRNSSRVPLFSN